MKAATKEGVNTPPLPDTCGRASRAVAAPLLRPGYDPRKHGLDLVGNPSGSLMLRDELADGSPGSIATIRGATYWLEAFGGRSYTVDRKGSPEPLGIPYNGVNVIGGIQPAKLADCLLHGSDDGLAARFLFTWPDRPAFSRPLLDG